ncbi:MAG: DegT/DnrJ/EryC1/StrS family aminotransferase [Candidatus Dormibacteraeota bacterium]|nr:DegT/DnrJ/EryC1/StrS family aminotransferase [Candidatus Dormibacteraeota bacterium]MBV9524889.1 DegT/DnrJ/EryC1/StrS family aminotransferase [Candidatus Dormibacteraeota bacterium]
MSENGASLKPIHISHVSFGSEEEAMVLAVLRSGHIAQGPMVERFEGLCAAMAGTRYAVAVANGTVALEAALEACGAGPGDEVITSPFTFAATLNAILRCGAVARFADVAADCTLDPASAESLITPKTVAVMPVHLYGLMAAMPAFEAMARRHSLALVEDAAQAHGATCEGRRAGSCGIGAFSFYATKNVTSGEGGCVTTDDAAKADLIRVLRNQGMRARYEYVMIGQNWRMTDITAALAVPQLRRLDELLAARRRNAAVLTRLLADMPELVTPVTPPGREHAWHQYTVLLPDGADRAAVLDAMARREVHCGVYYPALVWDHDAYRHHPGVVAGETPVAAAMASRCLSLPVHPALTDSDLERVAAALREALHAQPRRTQPANAPTA